MKHLRIRRNSFLKQFRNCYQGFADSQHDYARTTEIFNQKEVQFFYRMTEWGRVQEHWIEDWTPDQPPWTGSKITDRNLKYMIKNDLKIHDKGHAKIQREEMVYAQLPCISILYESGLQLPFMYLWQYFNFELVRWSLAQSISIGHLNWSFKLVRK